MKKNFILLILALTLTTGLLVGCTAYPGSQGISRIANRVSNAVENNGNPDIRNGNGNGGNANANNTGDNCTDGECTGGECTGGNGSSVNCTDGECTTGECTTGECVGGNGAGGRGGNGDCDGECTLLESNPSIELSPETANSETAAVVVTDGYGAAGALADSDLTVEEMLTYSIQDEYLAHAEYVYIIDAFGSIKPFSNIIRAEEKHIEALLPLFAEYGIAAPADTGSDHAVPVSSLTEAYEAGETAEIDNIAMYDEFLKQSLPDDVRTVFESLRAASEKHLAAFQKHL